MTIALPPEWRRTVLSQAEMEVYLRLQQEMWAQMQQLFPRLQRFSGPGRMGQVRVLRPYKLKRDKDEVK